MSRMGVEIYRLIPCTSRKGRVVADCWAIPGSETMSTDALKERCRKRGWRCRIDGTAR
jgi:hypothetical protein